MNVYIVGAGAVGTYLGAKLQRSGNSVIYAPRDTATVEPVDADLAIIAVKSYQTDSAIATLRRALRNPGATTIVTPQNGVGNEEKLAAVFGAVWPEAVRIKWADSGTRPKAAATVTAAISQ